MTPFNVRVPVALHCTRTHCSNVVMLCAAATSTCCASTCCAHVRICTRRCLVYMACSLRVEMNASRGHTGRKATVVRRRFRRKTPVFTKTRTSTVVQLMFTHLGEKTHTELFINSVPPQIFYLFQHVHRNVSRQQYILKKKYKDKCLCLFVSLTLSECLPAREDQEILSFPFLLGVTAPLSRCRREQRLDSHDSST